MFDHRLGAPLYPESKAYDRVRPTRKALRDDARNQTRARRGLGLGRRLRSSRAGLRRGFRDCGDAESGQELPLWRLGRQAPALEEDGVSRRKGYGEVRKTTGEALPLLWVAEGPDRVGG